MFAITGIIMTFTMANLIDKTRVDIPLYYVGNRTLIILVLNLLALKVGSIIKIYYYDLPITNIACYPIVREDNEMFWIVYAICGLSIPLLLNAFISNMYMRVKKIILSILN